MSFFPELQVKANLVYMVLTILLYYCISVACKFHNICIYSIIITMNNFYSANILQTLFAPSLTKIYLILIYNYYLFSIFNNSSRSNSFIDFSGVGKVSGILPPNSLIAFLTVFPTL